MLTKIPSLLNLRLMPKVFLPFSKIILILLALLFLPYLAFAYEDQTEKRLNLWPFFVYSKHKPKNLTRIELLGPFISKTSSPKEESFSLRPIYSSVKEIEDNRTIEKRTYFISPLGLYRENEEEIRFKLIPLIDKRTPLKMKDKNGISSPSSQVKRQTTKLMGASSPFMESIKKGSVQKKYPSFSGPFIQECLTTTTQPITSFGLL